MGGSKTGTPGICKDYSENLGLFREISIQYVLWAWRVSVWMRWGPKPTVIGYCYGLEIKDVGGWQRSRVECLSSLNPKP